jgi:hypothetical protein
MIQISVKKLEIMGYGLVWGELAIFWAAAEQLILYL